MSQIFLVELVVLDLKNLSFITVVTVFFWLLNEDSEIANIQYFMKVKQQDILLFLRLILYKYKIAGKLATWKPVTPKKSLVEPKLYTMYLLNCFIL